MNCAQKYFGEAIGLQFAITELRNEITVDVCQECPRLVTLALDGLQAQVDELVKSDEGSMCRGAIMSNRSDRPEIRVVLQGKPIEDWHSQYAQALISLIETKEQNAELTVLATEILRESHHGDQHFISCLLGDDPRLVRLRLAIVALVDYFREVQS